MSINIRPIAYYLPQFHPIPENDQAWGKGFTEWTNVKKAKPLFRGHHQPFVPTELGYYDLTDADVREKQAALAKAYGIEGFCYWHYWMGNGKRLLELPFNEVVNTGKPDFPFCLCWANHTWSKRWAGGEREIIVEQVYPGEGDHIAHFYALLKAFKDKRYIKVHGKLLFVIFGTKHIPDVKSFMQLWQNLAIKEGLSGFHFVGIGVEQEELSLFGVDAFTRLLPHPIIAKLPSSFLDKITYRITGSSWANTIGSMFGRLTKYSYKAFVKRAIMEPVSENEYPVVLPNWDYTPRNRQNGFVLHGSSPKLFAWFLRETKKKIRNRHPEEKIIFIKAWNEWAEGNFLEPEIRYGRGYLEAIKECCEND